MEPRTKTTLKKLLVCAGALSLGVAVTGLAVAPTTASAQFYRMHAASCAAPFAPSGGSGGTNMEGAHVVGGIRNFECPVMDQSDLRKEDIDAIEVYVWDGSAVGYNYSSVSLCAVDRDAADSGCLDAVSSNGSGYKTLVLDAPNEMAWVQANARADYFASLHVSLQSNQGNAAQRLIGYVVHD